MAPVNDGSSAGGQTKKTTKGEQKIQMKKIEKRSNLQVTFSKRRTGLFKKAAELHVLCGAEIAVIVQSPANKIFLFGCPSPDSAIRRFENRAPLCPYQESQVNYEFHHQEYLDLKGKLESEKGKGKAVETQDFAPAVVGGGNCSGGSGGYRKHWFEEDVDVNGLGLEEAEEYLAAMETLRMNLLNKADSLEMARTLL